MFIKTHPADLVSEFGIKTDETDELEMIFEEHNVYSMIRELPIASSRFWLFEVGAWDETDPSKIVSRSTPFVPLGDDVDDAARLVELMITHVTTDHNLPAWKRGEFKSFGIENGKTLTGQKWTEHAEFGEVPLTETEPYWPSVNAIKSNGMEN
jgi:hypothetical protein